MMTTIRHEPTISVGIMEGDSIRYSSCGQEYCATYADDFSEIYINRGPFVLHDVTIGKEFHWEQREDQTFSGALRIIAAEGRLHAINEVALEDYLASVISSEMAATNNLQLLMTHAIISRSWALRQMEPTPAKSDVIATPPSESGDSADNILMRWWDHDDHTLYDVCADDHCQRYQGTTRQISPLVAEAIRLTRGMVLTDCDGKTCDARFYKACGGHTERFSACWQDTDFHYLQPTPDPFCAPEYLATLPSGLDGVMKLVLNSYDQSTVDYHQWTEHFTAEELSSLVERRLGLGLGRVLALEPVERGASGRIVRLSIVGERRTVTIGKELLVRRALSESHLKSSWFDVEEHRSSDGPFPTAFTLHGHGWGHGVGLCQIGAAAMSLAGYTYDQILAHYYKDARIKRLYD